MNKPNTNLAAEFYVLSALHRRGADAILTVANKKAVDILVVHEAGNHSTIDVKGLAGTSGWPMDNWDSDGLTRHFLVLVCFKGEIEKLEKTPEVYIVPARKVGPLIYHAPGGRRLIQLYEMHQKGRKYKDAWSQLV
jgi:hypothetical protein